MERAREEGLADKEAAKPSYSSLILGMDMMDRAEMFTFPPHSYYDPCFSLSPLSLPPHPINKWVKCNKI